MAKDPAGAEEASAPPKKKKLLIIIVAVLVLAIAGGGAAFMLLGGKKKHGKQDEAQQEETVKDEESPETKPATVAFEEKFTVNLRSEDGSNHFIQVPKIELEAANDKIAKKVEEAKSKVSDRISSTLRSKTMQEMMEPGSDLKLKEELRNVINETIGVKEADKGVKEVILPASFIVQ